ncbi:MAG TPA: GNAT family N-acetyltransferase [Candidatus Dormibacteraeota bacterium]|nr:GNAT family N-acetyltransferase [Candidatus Dormibacteraeota bacterium]
MTATIRELSELEDLQQLAELFAEVWGRSGQPSVDSDILKALSYSGNYVSGAYQDGRLIGGLVGWLGGLPPGELHMHSHILGVIAGSEARGLGFELKQHQRTWCLERGIDVMEWTTDPLVRRNLYFNLRKLGASATRYLVNFYGAMTDGLNAGEESDRLLIRWQLGSPEARDAAAGRAPALETDRLIAAGASPILSVGDSGEPVAGPSSDARVLLCQVPADIVELRHTDASLARSWRLALRSALTGTLARGYAITGATRSGSYVLESQPE